MAEAVYDCAIIGAGVSGCAVARELSRYVGTFVVLEREEDVCAGTSKANSAIVHAGFDAEPGTLMAKLNVEGNERMYALADQLDFKVRRCGSLVVATTPEGRQGLEALLERGRTNGVRDLRIVDRDELLEMEPNISDEAVWEACRYVNADKFIGRLDQGLGEVVRERGNNFSAGQRQLLSFARTIIHKPAVMILDEATANIDTETELLIQDSLEKMKNIGTMLIVAHRLSTIQHCDNIILLDQGQIIEQGNHQELLTKKGRYHQLYMLQYSKEQLQNP
jgi:ATPase subunit of ABC transporter with duplicated ATPase domains